MWKKKMLHGQKGLKIIGNKGRENPNGFWNDLKTTAKEDLEGVLI